MTEPLECLAGTLAAILLYSCISLFIVQILSILAI
jgi:hypothetical protein